MIHDITGRRFGRLLIVSRAENNRHHKARWLCQCDCGDQKIINGRDVLSGRTNSCGCLRREVIAEQMRKPPIALRFWDLVNVRGSDECWEWQGKLTHGYGRIKVGSHKQYAHRVAWSLHYGCEPECCVLHHCDNRLCCNPAHLYEGTRDDNAKDRNAAGRWRGRNTGPMTPDEELATRGLRQSFN